MIAFWAWLASGRSPGPGLDGLVDGGGSGGKLLQQRPELVDLSSCGLGLGEDSG